MVPGNSGTGSWGPQGLLGVSSGSPWGLLACPWGLQACPWGLLAALGLALDEFSWISLVFHGFPWIPEGCRGHRTGLLEGKVVIWDPLRRGTGPA